MCVPVTYFLFFFFPFPFPFFLPFLPLPPSPPPSASLMALARFLPSGVFSYQFCEINVHFKKNVCPYYNIISCPIVNNLLFCSAFYIYQHIIKCIIYIFQQWKIAVVSTQNVCYNLHPPPNSVQQEIFKAKNIHDWLSIIKPIIIMDSFHDLHCIILVKLLKVFGPETYVATCCIRTHLECFLLFLVNGIGLGERGHKLRCCQWSLP